MIAEGHITGPAWRKSSYSGGGGGSGHDDCVEVAPNNPLVVLIRDSKRPGGPTLSPPRPAWAAFIAELKQTSA
ncbi:hypothetical protein GCM10010218_29570 [Streptomyces mashuensis]|uniref:DUF397 domain-containing protein n=1 Tax=Streptomyces mashuensis TaxID=33904 RepID=A0A919B4R4_9ACTN|nr:DUF397 domain-containing protein [Streptomyces mashuensis]GHF46392.1 hypothetical protein GCM10010218_29570 [Streptomyces mashuensis]